MAKLNLKQTRVVRSPTTNLIYVARFGVDPVSPLDKREATAETVAAVIEHMLEPGPSGAYKYSTGANMVVSFGKKRFKLSVEPLKEGDI